MKAIVSYFVILLTFSGILRGQDVHFSQSDFSPLLLNPSYTGRFHGDFRLINNYRSQWKTINKAYSTMDLTLDKPFSILGQQFGGGFIYLNDVSGNGSLTTNRFHCSFSYHEFWKNNQFSVGIQPGFVFRGFNHGNTTFPSQYNPSSGIYEPGLPDGEGLLDENIAYFNLNGGIAWRKKIRNLLPGAGLSMNHINRPVESFNREDEWPRVPLKYTFSGNVLIEFSRNISFNPRILVVSQGGAREFIAGGLTYLQLQTPNFSRASVFGGSYMRTNFVRNFDALILMGGIQLNNFSFALNYDINMSALRKASNFYGAFEFSIIYIYDRAKPENFREPCILF